MSLLVKESDLPSSPTAVKIGEEGLLFNDLDPNPRTHSADSTGTCHQACLPLYILPEVQLGPKTMTLPSFTVFK